MTAEQLTYIGTGQELQLARDPEAVLADAKRAADRLVDVIKKQKLPIVIKIGESEHLKLEAWSLLGAFYGLQGRIASVTPNDEFQDIKGYNAKAELIHVASEKVVATAESMCLDDEEKWGTRPKYAYAYCLKSGKDPRSQDEMRRRGLSVEDPGKSEIIWEDNPKNGKKRPKKERVQIGEETVPLFQLKSMAQTRALSKVYSIALRWIVVLAGYNPTPAEDLTHTPDDEYGEYPSDDAGEPGAKGNAAQSAGSGGATSTGTTTKPPATGGPYITPQQINDLWKLGFEPNSQRSMLDKPTVIKILQECGYDNISMITQGDLERVRKFVAAGEGPASAR